MRDQSAASERGREEGGGEDDARHILRGREGRGLCCVIQQRLREGCGGGRTGVSRGGERGGRARARRVLRVASSALPSSHPRRAELSDTRTHGHRARPRPVHPRPPRLAPGPLARPLVLVGVGVVPTSRLALPPPPRHRALSPPSVHGAETLTLAPHHATQTITHAHELVNQLSSSSSTRCVTLSSSPLSSLSSPH